MGQHSQKLELAGRGKLFGGPTTWALAPESATDRSGQADRWTNAAEAHVEKELEDPLLNWDRRLELGFLQSEVRELVENSDRDGKVLIRKRDLSSERLLGG